jgi:hypothetical protein
MRSLPALGVAALLAGALGCSLLGKAPPADPQRPTTPVATVTANKLVDYLDDRANHLQSISADVKFTAREGIIAAASLHGSLSVSQPRNFRMLGKGGLAGTVDLGSNSDQFWVYLEAPTTKPMFVYASHSDFEAGRAKLPGGIPFEPDWVMEALGMHIFPKDLKYNEPKLSQSERTYTLSWPSKTPTGLAVKKEVVFDADDTLQLRGPDGRDPRPQVKKHLIRDSKNNKLLCSAEVKRVSTISVPTGGGDSRPAQVLVQYPTHLVLRWEVQNFELDLTLENVQINQRVPDEVARRLFSRPAEYTTPAIDLAKYEYSIR